MSFINKHYATLSFKTKETEKLFCVQAKAAFK